MLTYIWFWQIHVSDRPRHLWWNLGFTVPFQAFILGCCFLLSSLPLLPMRRGEVVGVHTILCERPAAGVLNGPPGWTALTWVAPALVVHVSGRRSAREAGHVSAAAWGGVLLGREGGGLAQVGPPVWPVWHIQIVRSHRGAHSSWWGVHWDRKQNGRK